MGREHSLASRSCCPSTPQKPSRIAARSAPFSPRSFRRTGRASGSWIMRQPRPSRRTGGMCCTKPVTSPPVGPRSTAAEDSRRSSRSWSPRSSCEQGCRPVGATTRSALGCWATRYCAGGRRSRRSTTSLGSSPGRTSGARATPSPTPGRTSQTSVPERCSTATSGSSTARRSGPPQASRRITSSCCAAPTPTRRATRESRSCWSTCANPVWTCARSR